MSGPLPPKPVASSPRRFTARSTRTGAGRRDQRAGVGDVSPRPRGPPTEKWHRRPIRSFEREMLGNCGVAKRRIQPYE